MADDHDYIQVFENFSINLDRFYGDFKLYIYGGKDLMFNVFFEECRTIQNIFGFPENFRSVSKMQGTYMHVVFDQDLSENVYLKLADKISKNTVPMDLRLTTVENKFDDIDDGLVRDPVFSLSDLGEHKTLSEIVQAYAPSSSGGDMSDYALISTTDELENNILVLTDDLETQIESIGVNIHNVIVV